MRKTHQLAFAQPPMSRRRKTSLRIVTIIQIQMTHVKKIMIVHRTSKKG